MKATSYKDSSSILLLHSVLYGEAWLCNRYRVARRRDQTSCYEKSKKKKVACLSCLLSTDKEVLGNTAQQSVLLFSKPLDTVPVGHFKSCTNNFCAISQRKGRAQVLWACCIPCACCACALKRDFCQLLFSFLSRLTKNLLSVISHLRGAFVLRYSLFIKKEVVRQYKNNTCGVTYTCCAV